MHVQYISLIPRPRGRREEHLPHINRQLISRCGFVWKLRCTITLGQLLLHNLCSISRSLLVHTADWLSSSSIVLYQQKIKPQTGTDWAESDGGSAVPTNHAIVLCTACALLIYTYMYLPTWLHYTAWSVVLFLNGSWWWGVSLLPYDQSFIWGRRHSTHLGISFPLLAFSHSLLYM